ncbi:hypothetical protein KJ781_05085, partial [Patescibacteria group bacterium]|nr:hypothetical protein [Patescibacteria group bacterium]MBU1449182.1 hypothetical protein [Patescibacteria group bacterium]
VYRWASKTNLQARLSHFCADWHPFCFEFSEDHFFNRAPESLMQGTKAPYSLSPFRWAKYQLLAEAFGQIATSGEPALCRLNRAQALKVLSPHKNKWGEPAWWTLAGIGTNGHNGRGEVAA